MTSSDQRSDAELLLAARTCSEPFGVFYERHFASVLAFFRRRVRGPEEAFDLAAETFAAALASVPRFQPSSRGRNSHYLQGHAPGGVSQQTLEVLDLPKGPYAE